MENLNIYNENILENLNINENINLEKEEDCNKNTYDFYLLIYNISKKNNIGTLIRSASAFNVKKVLVLGENKKVLKKFFGSQGTVKKTEFLFFEDTKTLKEFCKENKIFICGIEIGEESKPIQSQPFKGNTLFVLGNEGLGMNRKQKEILDHSVYIPQYSSKTGSLNVAIAASIIFHHFGVWANYKEATFTSAKFDVQYIKGGIDYNPSNQEQGIEQSNDFIEENLFLDL